MKQRTILCIVLWLLSGPGLLRADQFMPLSLSELAGKADLIMLGSVLSKTCQQDEAGRIFTRVELQVAEVWKGAVASKILSVVHGGGILGGRRIAVSGQVEYTIGEKVVAFLVRNDRGEAVTLSLAQGKFHVAQDPNTSVKTVHNPFHGNPSASGWVATQESAVAARRLTLSQLKQAVQQSRQSAPMGQNGGLTQ
jgi:hypothetical protein